MKKYIPGLLLVIFFLSSCTENPFTSKENNKLEKEKISGTVVLNDSVAPDEIFVWLETFNLSTYTDEDGKFSITVPLPENQVGGTGFDGKFTLYFFMGNYKADSVDVEFSQGKFLEDQDNISNSGKLKNEIVLMPILNIRSVLDADDLDGIVLDFDREGIYKELIFELQLYSETQVIFSLREDNKWPARGFFRTGIVFEPVDDNYNPVFIESPDAFIYHNALLLNSSNSWTFELRLLKNDFEEIEYKAYPFLLVDHPYLPEKLWDALGREKLNFNKNYLHYPFKRTHASVTVIKG